MNIGILTFHWAANHGAILQTYALSHYLEQTFQAEVQIIDYYPRHMEHTLGNALKCRRPSAALQKLKERKKNVQLKPFRDALPVTKRFYTTAELRKENWKLDVLMTGSDQIWNPSFLRYGERKITPVYYLNFADKRTRRLSASASFGCKVFPAELEGIVRPLLQKFDGISVREDSGLDILHSMNVRDAEVTADPTALLSREEYLALSAPQRTVPDGSISKMILRKQSRATNLLIAQICSAYANAEVADLEYLSIPNWLAAIRDSRMVITNSFHCVMMCLKLHTPFAVILEQRSAGMNDRFYTLLSKLGLENRIISNTEDIVKLSLDIDFDGVDVRMEQYADSLRHFLRRNLT